MANTRLSMRNVREVLRLKYACGLSNRKIARIRDVARSTIAEILQRAETHGIRWPVPEAWNDVALESKLFEADSSSLPEPARPLPDYEWVQRELRDHKKLNLTLYQLWLEYKEQYPDGWQYTQFWEHYRRWRGSSTTACARSIRRARSCSLITETAFPLSIQRPEN